MGPDGLEPSTPRLSSACSNQLSYEPSPSGGVDRFRTDDLLHAKQALYQLSYDPKAALNIAFFRPVVKHHRSGKLLCALFGENRRSDSADISASEVLHRKEVIQPQVPLRLPCYDLVPITRLTLGRRPLAVG